MPLEPGSREFHMHVGKESITYNNKRTPRNMGVQAASPLQYVSFFGRCYHCKCSAHSQKYCPLRMCKQCKRYGHSELACWRKKVRAPNPGLFGPQSRGAPTARRAGGGR